MRIAMVAETFLPKVDGIVNTLCHLLEHLAAEGHQVLVLAPSGAPERHAGHPVLGFPAVRLPGYQELRVALPDGSVGPCLDRFRPDVLHVSNPLLLGATALRLAKARGIPSVAVYHTDIAGFARAWGLAVMEPLIWRLLRRVHGWADLNLCPSQAALDSLRQQGIQRLAVWGRGVDVERFRPERRDWGWRYRLSGGQPERPLLLYVGRLSPEKHVERLADVMDILPQACLAVVGDGPARRSLELRLAGRPVTFTGYLGGYALAAAYASADVFVFPGPHETFGNVVLEAMASGLPVVAPSAGALPELVRHEGNGLLFDPQVRTAMPDAVLRLLHRPPLARRLGRQARSDALERRWDRVGDDILRQYQSLARAAAAARDASPTGARPAPVASSPRVSRPAG